MSTAPSMSDQPAIQLKDVWVSFPIGQGPLEVLQESELISNGLGKLGIHSAENDSMRRKAILKGIDLSVARGSIHGIIGINGVGKTTTLNSIVGLVYAEGEIVINGKDVNNDMSTEQRREYTSRCVSKCNRNELSLEVKIEDNIAFKAALYNLDQQNSVEVGREMLRRLNVAEEDFEKPIYTLSFGTQLKVALVLALLPLLKEEKLLGDNILLLDEPTAGLDPKSRIDLFKIIQEFKTLAGVTIVIATNDPFDLLFCEAITVIVKGETGATDKYLADIDALKASMKDPWKKLEALVEKMSLDAENPDAKKVEKKSPDSEDAKAKDSAGKYFPSIAIAKRSPVRKAFLKRHLANTRSNPTLAFGVIATLVLPNLIGLLTIKSEPLRALLGFFVANLTGTVIRESLRHLDRERSLHRTLEMVLLSPMTRWGHVRATAGSSMLTEIKLTTGAFLIGVFFYAFPDFNGLLTALWDVGSRLSIVSFLGAFISLNGILNAAWTIGFLFSLFFLLWPQGQIFFVLSSIPMVAVTFSSIYRDVKDLPVLIQYAAQLSPIPYGMNALVHFLGVDKHPPKMLFLEQLVIDLAPGVVSQGFASLVVHLIITGVLFLFAWWTHEPLLECARKAGRLKNS